MFACAGPDERERCWTLSDYSRDVPLGKQSMLLENQLWILGRFPGWYSKNEVNRCFHDSYGVCVRCPVLRVCVREVETS